MTIQHPTKILIAVDGTPESRDAAETAYRFMGPGHDYTIASIGEAEPLVVSGFGVGAIPTAADLHGELEAAVRSSAEATADEARKEFPGQANTTAEVGHIGQLICAIAEEGSYELIVIGSHDRGFWSRLVDPPVGRYLVENAPCPVLVVR